jgi:hypothetical protein
VINYGIILFFVGQSDKRHYLSLGPTRKYPLLIDSPSRHEKKDKMFANNWTEIILNLTIHSILQETKQSHY